MCSDIGWVRKHDTHYHHTSNFGRRQFYIDHHYSDFNVMWPHFLSGLQDVRRVEGGGESRDGWVGRGAWGGEMGGEDVWEVNGRGMEGGGRGEGVGGGG